MVDFANYILWKRLPECPLAQKRRLGNILNFTNLSCYLGSSPFALGPGPVVALRVVTGGGWLLPLETHFFSLFFLSRSLPGSTSPPTFVCLFVCSFFFT